MGVILCYIRMLWVLLVLLGVRFCVMFILVMILLVLGIRMKLLRAFRVYLDIMHILNCNICFTFKIGCFFLFCCYSASLGKKRFYSLVKSSMHICDDKTKNIIVGIKIRRHFLHKK